MMREPKSPETSEPVGRASQLEETTQNRIFSTEVKLIGLGGKVTELITQINKISRRVTLLIWLFGLIALMDLAILAILNKPVLLPLVLSYWK